MTHLVDELKVKADASIAVMRDAALRAAIVGDGHAPARFRAQTVRNITPWYDAYGVKAGEKMYLAPEDRVQVW